MALVEITVKLPQALADKAVNFDLFTDERFAALIEREILREAAWKRLETAMDIVQESAAEKYAHLSEDEVMEMVVEEIKTMRAENRAQEINHPPKATA